MGLFGSASANAGTVAVDVEGDFKKFRGQLEREGSAAGDKVGSSFSGSFGKKIATLGAAYLGQAFARSTIEQASDLAESINVTGLAFGDARGQADAFAKSASRNLGLAESEARALQAMLGNVIVGFGASQDEAAKASQDLITRAADIGSAWTAGTQEVSDAIIAAFTTSTEPIRRFGVIIDEAAIKQRALELGLIGSGDELDNNSKRLAVTSLIMEQTDNVAGDFLNTQDGVANSAKQVTAMWKDMQAQLGTALLPALSAGLGLFKALGPEGMKLVVIGGLIAFGMAKIADASRSLGGAFTALAANPWLLAALAIVAAGVAIYRNWDTIKAKGDELLGWFDGIARRIGASINGVIDIIANPFRSAFSAIARAWNATVGQLSFSLPSWVPGVGGKSWSAPKIPALASGAVASSPMVGMFGEYPGAARNPEVVSPVDLMRSTFLDALAAAPTAGAGAGVNITIERMEVRNDRDIELIARELERRVKREQRAQGRQEVNR